MAYGPEFQEIAHCGGKIIVTVVTDAMGRRGVKFGVEHSAPRPAAWFTVHSFPPGIPVATIQFGGIGPPNSLPVSVGSDSQGLFGHECPACQEYWRSKALPATSKLTCPYCGVRGDTHEFLTAGQRRFVEAVCDLALKALEADTDGEHVIDMDQVADQKAKTNEKPRFYYTEKSQQNHYTCTACGGADDILGCYGYCSYCGMRSTSGLMSPNTTRSASATIKGSAASTPTRSRTSPTRSTSRAVGTSRVATSATRGMVASLPSRGSPAANQSAFPA
jgi:hypothetical protein